MIFFNKKNSKPYISIRSPRGFGRNIFFSNKYLNKLNFVEILYSKQVIKLVQGARCIVNDAHYTRMSSPKTDVCTAVNLINIPHYF